ncbi:hypothetical protein J2T12_002601 [Paenibacillus anaericanus]|nr:hypothetical protein [Paenibacillus anaericanus]
MKPVFELHLSTAFILKNKGKYGKLYKMKVLI